jgi:predicted O-methyltransferase YrrM
MIDSIFTGCWAAENVAFACKTLARMPQDKFSADIDGMLQRGEITTIWLVLPYLAWLLKPARYLEVGVRRGWSMGLVAARAPECDVVGFDLWVEDYAGAPNPGPASVREEMVKLGHRGELRLIDGDSAKTLPAFVAESPPPYPLILVDGDHSYEGAYRDLKCCLGLLAPGGYLVADDMHNNEVYAAWVRATSEDGRPRMHAGWAGVLYGA